MRIGPGSPGPEPSSSAGVQCCRRDASSEGRSKRAARGLYARVSTADQSCERQVSELTSFAERCGHDVAETFRDTTPGASVNCAARKRVMALAQARQIDTVLVSELSRWGRSTQDLLATLHQLESTAYLVHEIGGALQTRRAEQEPKP
ncbi:MAG: recombinase family protein [Boseongicola sp.]|nr:recombinase family protein [Boseongicola sp.]